MKDPVFLSLDDILQIHDDTITNEGGTAGPRAFATQEGKFP